METITRERGCKGNAKDKALSSTRREPGMKEAGRMTSIMVAVPLFTLTRKNIKEAGSRANVAATVSFQTRKAFPFIEALSWPTNTRWARVLLTRQMACMSVTSRVGRSMAREP